MSPPRWPFLVEIDALSQLNMFYATEKRTTVPVGMRVVAKSPDRDTYFIAPLGLHLLYRRWIKRHLRAQGVLRKLREGNAEQQNPWAPPTWVTTTATTTNLPVSVPICTCGTCQPALVPSTTQTP